MTHPNLVVVNVSGFEDRENLAFGDGVIDGDEDGFELSRSRGSDRDLHLHGFDEGNFVAEIDGVAGADWKTTDTACDFADDLDFRHICLRGEGDLFGAFGAVATNLRTAQRCQQQLGIVTQDCLR